MFIGQKDLTRKNPGRTHSKNKKGQVQRHYTTSQKSDMGEYVLCGSIHVKKGKKTVVTTRQEHESCLQEEHDGTFGIVITVPTLIWAVANMAVHMLQ